MTFQEQKEQKKQEITRDFKILDLTSTDEELLDKLASSLVLLEKLESKINHYLELLDQDPDNIELISAIKNLNDTTSKLRSDISKFQNDLGITRKQRSSEDENSISDYIAKLKKAAKLYAEYRTTLVFCDTCNYMIGMVWWASGKRKGNKASFVCPKCKKVVEFAAVNSDRDVVPNDYNRVPQYM